MSEPAFAAVVLAGGAGRRMGGADKPALAVGGRPMVARVLDAAAEARPRVVVGPPRIGLPADVRQVREDPPGGGPVAAVAAGLAALRTAASRGVVAAPGDGPEPGAVSPPGVVAAPGGGPEPGAVSPPGVVGAPGGGPEPGAVSPPGVVAAPGGGLVAVLAADLPYLTGAVLRSLVTALVTSGFDGAVLVDEDGRRQLLCGVWRVEALLGRLGTIGDPTGRSMRRLVDGLRVAEVRVGPATTPPPWYDCDTEADLRRAEEWHERTR